MGEQLDDILSDETEEDVTPETPEEPEAEQSEEAEAQAEAEPEAKEEPEEPKVPLAALQAERSEARELKEQLRALQQQVSQMNAPKPEPAPDVIEDPQGYQGHLVGQVGQIANNLKLEMSEEMARDRYGDADVDAAFDALREANDPVEYQRIMATRSPWVEMVKWHKRSEVSRQIGDNPDEWIKSKEAEIRKQIEAEMTAQRVAQNVSQPKAAPSLAAEPNLGSRSAPAWSGPASLNDILGS